jgi:hypothetical protein
MDYGQNSFLVSPSENCTQWVYTSDLYNLLHVSLKLCSKCGSLGEINSLTYLREGEGELPLRHLKSRSSVAESSLN